MKTLAHRNLPEHHSGGTNFALENSTLPRPSPPPPCPLGTVLAWCLCSSLTLAFPQDFPSLKHLGRAVSDPRTFVFLQCIGHSMGELRILPLADYFLCQIPLRSTGFNKKG